METGKAGLPTVGWSEEAELAFVDWVLQRSPTTAKAPFIATQLN